MKIVVGKPKSLRDWWASVASLLDYHVRALAAGAIVEPLPFDVVNALKGFAGYLAIGQIPGSIDDVRAEGRRAPGPTECRDIGLAVAYLRAAKGGIDHHGDRIVIVERAPVKRVCEAFTVERTTVQGWQRNVPAAFLGVTPINADILTHLMMEAGERYRNAGRSTKATLRRGRN